MNSDQHFGAIWMNRVLPAYFHNILNFSAMNTSFDFSDKNYLKIYVTCLKKLLVKVK